MILDWWLTPELYLRRPPAFYPEWRLDRLLKRKAEQGVKVYVVVYKEVRLPLSRGVGIIIVHFTLGMKSFPTSKHQNNERNLFAGHSDYEYEFPPHEAGS